MRLIYAFFLLVSILSCSSTPQAKPKSVVAETALKWKDCPPSNPRRPEVCTSACCGDGSNWDLSCITFVGEITREVYGRVDSDILAGYSKHPGVTFGSAVVAFESMKQSGRAQFDGQNITPGAAVFFEITGFRPGHIAIYSGLKDSQGDLLIVSTGGPQWGSGIQLESLSKLKALPHWRFLGWAAL